MTDRRLNLKLFRNVSFLQNGELTNGSMVSASIFGVKFLLIGKYIAFMPLLQGLKGITTRQKKTWNDS